MTHPEIIRKRFPFVVFPQVNGMLLIAWSANVLLIVGAILVSVHQWIAAEASVFFLFLTGHLFMSAYAIRNRDKPTLVLNGFLSILDLYAIIVRL